jgi:hypothetical protein
MKAIVIATTKDRSDWAKQCYDSLKDYKRYPVIILDHYEYELGKIRWVLDNTTLDEFIFLQDSVVLKTTDWLDEVFDYDGSVSLAKRPFFMYLGKYRRAALEQTGLPMVNTKKEAVDYESTWTREYAKSDNFIALFDLSDTNHFEEHLGRRNMIIDNDRLIKYKHIWSGDMIYDY